MAKTLSFYVNNTAPSLTITVKRKLVPIDLTGATVRIQMMKSGTNVLAIDDLCVVIAPPTSGQVRYDWKVNDLNEVATYSMNLRIIYANGTFENTETTTVMVLDGLPTTETYSEE